MSFLSIFFFIFAGISSGFFSSFFGIGGGVIVVPILYSIFPNLLPVHIIAISHFLVFLNTFSNSAKFYRLKYKIVWLPVLVVTLFMLSGVQLGYLLVHFLQPKTVKLLFVIFLILLSIKNFLNNKNHKKNEVSSKENLECDASGNIVMTNDFLREFLSFKSIFILSIGGLFGGIVAGLTGIGGGIVIVPLFLFLSVPVNIMPYFSNLSMCVTSFVTTLLNIVLHYQKIDLTQLVEFPHFLLYRLGVLLPVISILLFIFAYPGRVFGFKVSCKISAHKKIILFNILIILIALKIYIKIS